MTLAIWHQLAAFPLLGNTAQQWVLALAMFLLIFVALRLLMQTIIRRARILAKRTKTKVDDLFVHMLEKISISFYAAFGLFAGMQFVILPSRVHKALLGLVLVLLVYASVGILQRFILALIRRFWFNTHGDEAEHVESVLGILVKIVLWSVGILLILSNIGINVTSLIASLGIGGVAVALALQNVLGDLFSSFSIYFDKPFRVGDFIVAGTHMGTVKKVGLKTTRIQALQGEEIVISNQELITARIQNFKRMTTRRVEFRFDVVYGTPIEKLRAIPAIVREVIEAAPHTKVDRVHLKTLGDSGIEFEAVYTMQTAEHLIYMDTQQQINLDMLERFQKEGMEMAYPTQTVYIARSS